MALDAQGYPVGFQEWWQKNVTNEPNIALRRKRAAEGRQFLDILLRKEQGKITKEEEEKVRKEAQDNANIVGLGGPLLAAAGTALGSALLKEGGVATLKENLGGLLGLGEKAAAAEAAQQVGTQAVAPAVQAGTQAANGVDLSATQVPTEGGVWETAPRLGNMTSNPTLAAGLNIGQGVLGAYSVYDSIKNGEKGVGGGLKTGMGTFSTLSSMGVPPQISLPIAAAAALASGFGLLGDKSTKEIQSDRWKDVGRSDLDMVGRDYFAGTGGEKSRDESFLTPDAIRSNPDNYHAASDWDSWNRAQQDQFLSTLLAEKKVQEKKGGIYYDDDRAKQLADQIRSGNFPAMGMAAAAVPTFAQNSMNLLAQRGPGGMPKSLNVSPAIQSGINEIGPSLQRPGGLDEALAQVAEVKQTTPKKETLRSKLNKLRAGD